MDNISKDELIKKVGDLKVLPFVARKVLETLKDESCTIDDLTNIIEKDQTIAARVLKISNSALYGLRQEVTSLHQAILILGFKTIRSLVLSVSTRSLYKNFGMKEKILWDHSVGAAIAAKTISAGFSAEIVEVSFIGGLMHDFGKVVMNNETPDIFAEVIMKIYNEGADSVAAEEEIYGYNHAEIGSGVVEKWGFSPLLVEILKNHHLKGIKFPDIEDPLIAKGIAIANLADYICKVLGIGYRDPDDTIELYKLPSAVFLNLHKDRLNTLVKNIEETYNMEKAIFE
ncbi:MAG: HDOD domain-containing protein [Nitrospirae bacterium]|nr:HDOD domain-containing protein [Nitrospirota bacterium]MBI4847270.1 HDOD domain-containing protein [Nitrospirota bacterium]